MGGGLCLLESVGDSQDTIDSMEMASLWVGNRQDEADGIYSWLFPDSSLPRENAHPHLPCQLEMGRGVLKPCLLHGSFWTKQILFLPA